MPKSVGSQKKSTYIEECSVWDTTGLIWTKRQQLYRKNVKSVSSRYTRKRAMLYLLQKIRGLPSWNTWLKGSYQPTGHQRISLKNLRSGTSCRMGSYSKKGTVEIPLRCLGPKEAREVVKKVHSSDCGSHPGKRRLYKQLLLLGYYWPTMKSDSEELVKTCHACQILRDAIHTHPNVL